MRSYGLISAAAFLSLCLLSTNSFADVPPPESAPSTAADWGYILRGVLFIFSSALAAVWIRRRLAGRKK